jgi:hypothetical protein
MSRARERKHLGHPQLEPAIRVSEKRGYVLATQKGSGVVGTLDNKPRCARSPTVSANRVEDSRPRTALALIG